MDDRSDWSLDLTEGRHRLIDVPDICDCCRSWTPDLTEGRHRLVDVPDRCDCCRSWTPDLLRAIAWFRETAQGSSCQHQIRYLLLAAGGPLHKAALESKVKILSDNKHALILVVSKY